MKFTSEQFATMLNDRNLIVIANAGSGKTTILVEKYLNLILEKDVDEINRVVAITFTKKAASEMKDRLIERLNEEIEKIKEEIKSSKDFLQKYYRLMSFREHISSAKIQTIHSFSQELFKEFSAETGYNPIFSIIDEGDFDEVFNNIFLEIFEDILVNPYNYNINLNLILESNTQNKFLEIIKKIVENNEIYDYLNTHLNNINKQDFQKEYFKNLTFHFNEITQKCITLLNKHLGSIEQDGKKESFNNILRYLNTINIQENPPDYHKYYLEIINNWNEIKKVKIKGNSTIKKYLDTDYDSFNESCNLLNDFKTIQFFDNYYDILLNLFKFSEIIYNKIEEFKKENSLITYNDMLWKTYKILQNNEITNKIREKYDYILVDEFQDTDNVQYDILTKLVPSLKRINHKSKLFVVGDPKQSIYGFRNADVRVIKSTETDITSINSELIEKNELTLNAIIKMINHEEKCIDLKDTEARGKIELKISHRLNIVNTAFINHIFSRLMQFSDFDYSVTYNPFIYARKTPNIDNLLNLNEIEFNNEDYSNGMVNFLISIITNKKDEEDTEFNNNANNNEKSDVNNSDQDEEDDESEAMLTVNYIKYLLNNDKKIWDSKLNVYRKIQINDIAILIRKRSNIKNLTNLLNKEKIPYFLNESDNFFDNQEIIDIINYLRFLYNKNDDLAFSALLKSNFFGLLDDEIYEIRNFDENQSLWNSLNLFNASNEKYEKILEDINKLLLKFQNLTIKELVNEIIEESNYLSTYLKNPLFNVILNNIYNLKIYINKLFDKGINNLSDLLKEIDKSIKYSNFDNAMISTDANSLNILTIHKSKGLEFPVVILYNTNSKTPNLGNILFHENFGLNFDFLLKNEDGETVNVKMPSLNLCKQYLSKKDDEESKRLLYVALTRAKDILTITSSIKRKVNSNEEKYSKASGLFKLILNAFDLDVNNFVNNAINQNFEFEEPVEIYAENLTNTIKVKAKLPVYTSFKSSTLNISSTVKNEIEENDYLLIDEIIQKEPVNKFSATKLQAFIHKPIEFVEKYLFQYPKIFFEEEKFTPSGKLLTAADRGTIIHNIMMNIKNWYSSTKYINYNYLNEIINNYQNSQNILINDNDKELIINEITMVVNSHFIQTNLHYLLDAKFEYELNVPLFNNLFKVIYDVLILNKDEEYEIWDWKSNKILNNEDIQLKAKYYELQMKIYALVLTYLYPNNNKYIAKLIFTNYVVNSKEDFDWIVTFEWSKSELKDFEKEISNLINKTSDVEIIQKYLNDI